jgi:hypothetical protein
MPLRLGFRRGCRKLSDRRGSHLVLGRAGHVSATTRDLNHVLRDMRLRRVPLPAPSREKLPNRLNRPNPLKKLRQLIIVAVPALTIVPTSQTSAPRPNHTRQIMASQYLIPRKWAPRCPNPVSRHQSECRRDSGYTMLLRYSPLSRDPRRPVYPRRAVGRTAASIPWQSGRAGTTAGTIRSEPRRSTNHSSRIKSQCIAVTSRSENSGPKCCTMDPVSNKQSVPRHDTVATRQWTSNIEENEPPRAQKGTAALRNPSPAS